MVLENLAPRHVWEIFEDLFVPTPRKSHEEAKMRDRLKKWVLEQGNHGLTITEDKSGNLLITKEPSKEREGKPSLLFQGHMDMVYETNLDEGFNFNDEPIPVRIQDGNEWVDAAGTTLGADNGIGLSIILGLFIDETFKHGPLELLVTHSEEAGLVGAFEISNEELHITSRAMVNVDSENLGVITIGSAGGGDLVLKKKYPSHPSHCADDFVFFEITVAGLLGGHSGVDIHLPRANAIKIVGRILLDIIKHVEILISSWTGGTRSNAIPRESTIKVAVRQRDVASFLSRLNELSVELRNEFQAREPDLIITHSQAPNGHFFTLEDSGSLVHLVDALPHGPKDFSSSMQDLVETSNNLASIHVVAGSEDDDEGKENITILLNIRSNDDMKLEDFRRSIANIKQLAGWHVESKPAYPGWKPEPDSQFLKFIKDVYENVTRDAVKIHAVHAGLECGVIRRVLPQLAENIVSIGPTIENPHTPNERVSIASVEVMYKVLKQVASDFSQMG
ncbi:MAG: beta-Ala-His dipeptidase [Promethearchaeota archaeon]